MDHSTAFTHAYYSVSAYLALAAARTSELQPPVAYASAKQSTRPRQIDITFSREVGKKHIMHVKAECMRKVSVHGNKHGVMLLVLFQHLQTRSYNTTCMQYATRFTRAMIHFKNVLQNLYCMRNLMQYGVCVLHAKFRLCMCRCNISHHSFKKFQ